LSAPPPPGLQTDLTGDSGLPAGDTDNPHVDLPFTDETAGGVSCQTRFTETRARQDHQAQTDCHQRTIGATLIPGARNANSSSISGAWYRAPGWRAAARQTKTHTSGPTPIERSGIRAAGATCTASRLHGIITLVGRSGEAFGGRAGGGDRLWRMVAVAAAVADNQLDACGVTLQ